MIYDTKLRITIEIKKLIYNGDDKFFEKLKNIPKGTSIEDVKKIYINLIKNKDKIYNRPKRDEMDNDSRIVGVIDSVINNMGDPLILIDLYILVIVN